MEAVGGIVVQVSLGSSSTQFHSNSTLPLTVRAIRGKSLTSMKIRFFMYKMGWPFLPYRFVLRIGGSHKIPNECVQGPQQMAAIIKPD